MPFSEAASLAAYEDLFTVFEAGAVELRQTFGTPAGDAWVHLWLEGLAADRLRERVTFPLRLTDGGRHVMTFATDVPEGLPAAHAGFIADLLSAFALVAPSWRLRAGEERRR